MERVRDLVTEYGEDGDHPGNRNPASLHEFLQRIKVILNADTDMSEEDDNVAGGSSSRRMDISSSSSAAKAMGNHVVLREIFKCGSPGDLNNFRRFDGQWKMIANSLIIQRRLWKLKFKVTFGGSKSNKKRNETLTKLNDCIEASGGSFPLTTLDLSDFKDYSNLNPAALLRFYDLMGHSIKRLVLNNFGPLTQDEFRNLLEKKMPNVDHINAGNIFCPRQSQEFEFPPLGIVLPNLKTIGFMHDKPTKQFRHAQVLPYYKDLLLAAPNLKRILDFRVQLTDLVIETGKMDCIQKLVIDLPVASEAETCSYLCAKYSYTGPKLTSLSISTTERLSDENELFCPPVLAESVKRILISSKDTLRHLQWVSRIFPVDFQLPKFPNLEMLTVIEYKYRSRFRSSTNSVPVPIFPLGCDCSETFPNVTTVSLNTDDTGYSISRSANVYFKDQVFPSVKTLKFHNSFHYGREFKRIFPNVSHIQTRSAFALCDPQGFDLENQIESLEFNQCRLDGHWQGFQFQLDCLFTGAPRDVCSNLLRMYKKRRARGEDGQDAMMVQNILEAVQTRHYIFRNSKGLRRLKINFNHKVNANFRMPPEKSRSNKEEDCDLEMESEDGNNNMLSTQGTVITPVSCVYGFSLMPNLEEVIISYDHALPNAADIAQVLKPLAEFPYIKILHEPTE